MSNNPFGNGGGGMGFPFPMMFLQQEREPYRREQLPNIVVPARIEKAMEFLHHLAAKRRQMPAMSDHQIDWSTPDALSAEEVAAQDSALQLLTKYFDGKLEPDSWEKVRFDAIKNKAENNISEGVGRVITCPAPACRNMPQPNCPLCGGTGRVHIQPANGMDDPDEE